VCALVYEYCRLGSLEDALLCRGAWLRKPMSGTQRFEMLYQACIGLLELHSQDILHLDFKPANVLLDGPLGADRDASAVSARIGDFGMAKRMHQLTAAPDETANSTLPTRTNRTQLWVTEGYACPEYVQTKRGSDRTDVYAMGITIFRTVTGKHPSGSGVETLKTSIEKALRRGSAKEIEKRVAELCDPAARWCARASMRLLKLGLRCVANVPDERPGIEEVRMRMSVCARVVHMPMCVHVVWMCVRRACVCVCVCVWCLCRHVAVWARAT
jgi:serine/threonine protein kinase